MPRYAATDREVDCLLPLKLAHDAVTFGAVALMIAVVAALATFFPALSASRTDPARVLRTEG